MYHWFKFSHRKHSGRFRPHEYTSYLPLSILLLIVGLALTVTTVSAGSGPGDGSIGLTGTMPGIAPKVAATITSPVRGQSFTTTPITIAGSCPANTLVEIYKNDIFAGSGPCTNGGGYSFQIDLLNGQNLLIARVYDSLNQPGPDSIPVTAFYNALPTQAAGIAPLNFGGTQLLLNTDAVYRGIFPNQPLSIPIEIIGGTPPYAVDIQWGDTTNKIIARNDNITFNAEHTYLKAGTYQITIQTTDAQGRVAFLTVAAIVNGQPGLVASTGSTPSTTNKLLVLWPLYTSSAAMVLSFWLGERREKHILRRPPFTFHPQA